MKNPILIFIVVLFAGRCSNSTEGDKLLLEKDFGREHSDWQVMNDTISKDAAFGYPGMEVPLKVSWLVAKDTSGCLRIAYLKLQRYTYESKIDMHDLKYSTIPCAMKWESEDTRRFETLVFSGQYSSRKGIKKYTYSGKIGEVKGNGEYSIMELK